MNWNLLSDLTSQALAAALGGTAARHEALAHNIANIDTPGFTRTDVEFEQALAGALRDARRASRSPRQVNVSHALRPRRDHSVPARADGNNVDVDREMVALARNALSHRAASQMLAARIRMLRSAIREGRG